MKTNTTTDVNFCSRRYEAGVEVTILSPLVHDGVALCRFPGGEEAYLTAVRLENPPTRIPLWMQIPPSGDSALAVEGR